MAFESTHHAQVGPSLRRGNALGCERLALWSFARVEGTGQLHGSYASGVQSGGMEGMPMGGRGTIPRTDGGSEMQHDGMADMKLGRTQRASIMQL